MFHKGDLDFQPYAKTLKPPQVRKLLFQGNCNPLQKSRTPYSLSSITTEQKHFNLLSTEPQYIDPNSSHYLLKAFIQDFNRPILLSC